MLRAALEAQAPPKQNATDTINTLSERLNNSTLLEDRRSAILGLRSFARQYPASVASTSLRGLISSLGRDIEDIDTGKVVLETLLNLFNADENSPEASDDISLWLADIFSQRQDNITVLLDLLDQADFYSRLYSLQLLTAISTARPERTQECILSAPLGTTRLVAVLDDAREPVRSAGLVLLNEVTQGSAELQKLVAFEGAFESIFDLIKSEGSISLGGVVVQDCLSLLANLIQHNPSNQTSFRESGFVPRLRQLLEEDKDDSDEDDNETPDANKDRNLWGFLAVLRMFVDRGQGTKDNQIAFVRHGLLQQILDLSFDSSVELRIRAEALKTCADIIRGNAPVQEGFGGNQVRMHPTTDGENGKQSNGATDVYVIDALLDLALTPAPVSSFDMRFAACEVVQAYFHNHKTIRLHFIDRAIYGFTSGQDETSNILAVLLSGTAGGSRSDPYRIWFAALLAFRLTFEEPEAKSKLRSVSEGDAEQGEEVVTCIQSMTANLLGALQAKEDGRIVIAYLMLLCTWLFEDAESVNDLLAEGSTVQSLIRTVAKPDRNRVVEQGLIALLLSILYEYSTKDSPISRRKLQPLLTNGIGKDNLTLRLAELRKSSLLREFEVTPQDLSSAEAGMLPEVYFDQVFVDFFKDNYSRASRALDKDPGVETVNRVEGVNRDLVDTLRAEIVEKAAALADAQNSSLEAQQRLEQTRAEIRKLEQRLQSERGTLKTINERLHNDHEAELGSLKLSHDEALGKLQTQHQRELQLAQTKSAQDLKEARARFDKEMADLRTRLGKEISEARSKPERELKDLRNEMRNMRTKHELDLREARAKAEKELSALRARAEQAEAELKSLRANQAKHEQDLKEARARLAKDLDEAQKKHQQALKDAKTTHDAELSNVKGSHQSQLLEAQAAHEKEASTTRSKHEKDLRDQSSKHDGALGALTTKHEGAMTALTTKHEGAMTALSTKHEGALSTLTAKHGDEIKAKDNKHKQTLAKSERDLQDLQSKHDKAIETTQAFREEHKVELEKVQILLSNSEKALAESEKAGKDDVATLRVQLSEAQQEIKTTTSKHAKELKEVESNHSKSLASATSKAGDVKKELKAAKDDATKLEKDLAAAQEELSNARDEAAEARREAEEIGKRASSADASAAALIKLEKDLTAARKETKSAQKQSANFKEKHEEAEKSLKDAEKRAAEATKKAASADESASALAKAKKDLAASQTKLEEVQRQAEKAAKKASDGASDAATASAASLAKLQKDLAASQKETEQARKEIAEADKKATENAASAAAAAAELEKDLTAARAQAETARTEADEAASSASKTHADELDRLQKRVAELEKEAASSAKTVEQLRTVNGSTLEKVKERDSRIKTLEESKHADKTTDKAAEKAAEKQQDGQQQTKLLEKQLQEQRQKHKDLRETLEDLRVSAAETDEARQTAKAELDDLLLVLGDLEEKRARDKAKLKELGEKTSDDEASDEEEEDDEDEDDEEEEDEEDDDDANGPRSSDVD